MLIRPAMPSDMDSIYLMGLDAWGEGSSTPEYLIECRTSSKYKQGQWHCLQIGETLLSSLILYKGCFGLAANYAGFGSIATAATNRNNGYASALINACVDQLALEGCYGVYLHSETQSNIYDRLGFKAISRAKDIQLLFLAINGGKHESTPSYF